MCFCFAHVAVVSPTRRFPDKLYLRGRRVTAAQYLGLHNTAPEKEFFFGSELSTLDPTGGRRQWWSLNEVLTRLREVYTGTLTVRPPTSSFNLTLTFM